MWATTPGRLFTLYILYCFWVCLEVRGQFVRVSSFFVSFTFQGSNSGCQLWQQAGWRLAPEPSFELSGLCYICFHVLCVPEYLVWACVRPLSSSRGLVLSCHESIVTRALLLIQLHSVHSKCSTDQPPADVLNAREGNGSHI